MNIIHFTSGAADPLDSFDASGARFLPLADGEGDTHISCLHLETGAKVSLPSLTHASALLVVHGGVTLTTKFPETQIGVHAGMGAVFDQDEAYFLNSEEGAILLVVEARELTSHPRAISSPQRVAGATWPSDRSRA